jgi:hypothetical protein
MHTVHIHKKPPGRSIHVELKFKYMDVNIIAYGMCIVQYVRFKICTKISRDDKTRQDEGEVVTGEKDRAINHSRGGWY